MELQPHPHLKTLPPVYLTGNTVVPQYPVTMLVGYSGLRYNWRPDSESRAQSYQRQNSENYRFLEPKILFHIEATQLTVN